MLESVEPGLMNVRLRAFSEDDIPLLLAWSNQESEKDLLRWAGPVFTYPLTGQQVRQYLAASRPEYLFCIEADDQPVGIIELNDIQKNHGNARIGKVFIGSREHRARGIGSQAVRMLLEKAFSHMGLHKVSLSVLSENSPAIRTYLRCGFVEEGRLREQRLSGGRWHDLIQMGILKTRWEEHVNSPRDVQLHTDRLILHTPLLKDAQACCDYVCRNRKFLRRWGPNRGERYYTKAGQERIIIDDSEQLRAHRAVRFWISRKDDPDSYIGNISISHIIMGNFCSAFLGYQLDKDQLRKGYMHEALTAVITYSFRELGLHRLEANIMSENIPSRRLVEKLGFRQEGLGKDYLNIGGVWTDHLRYALLSTEWYAHDTT
jgi:ribosomal-protein-alanine N-acetyltransferase